MNAASRNVLQDEQLLCTAREHSSLQCLAVDEGHREFD